MESLKNLTIRKLCTTFCSTTIFSFLIVFIFSITDGFLSAYNRGNQFIGLFFLYYIYVGFIILFYGNVVSILVEKLQSRWFKRQDWLYIMILGVFGLANGLFFPTMTYALLGMSAAVLYGIIDTWLSKRMAKGKRINMFIILPVIPLVICWGYLQFTSITMPAFTKEAAVDFATSGEGTAIENFPKTIGEWEGMIDGYHVKRATSAKDIGKGVYIVTFTEEWKKEDETGIWSLSYHVERGSLTLKDDQGKAPPYY